MTLYSCVQMDPPWMERGGGKIKRGADRHYPLVPTKKLPAVILGSGVFAPAPSAHLWMWATKNFLEDAFWLMGQLGFRYVTDFAWVKVRDGKLDVDDLLDAPKNEADLQIGLGQYGRGAHELLLLGTRGAAMVPTPENRLPDVFFAERGRHSAKPEKAYRLIERVSPGPRLEMFARSGRDGWTAWGNEAPAQVTA